MPNRRPRKRSDVSPDDPDARLCLRCQHWFRSAGKGNRICEKCNDVNRNVSRRDIASPHRSPYGPMKCSDLLDAG